MSAERTSPLMHPSESNDIADGRLREAESNAASGYGGTAAEMALVSIAASLRNISFSLYHIAQNTRKEIA